LPDGVRARREIAAAGLLGALGIVVLSLPAGFVGRLLGMVRDAEGKAIVPALPYVVGSACLAAATWAAVRALTCGTEGRRDSPGARLGLIVLGLAGAAEAGGLLRPILQIADLHDFYLTSAGGPRAPTAYWGLTILAIGTAAFALPLVVAVANLLPHDHGPERYRRAVRRISGLYAALLLPIVGGTAIVAICSLLPTPLRVELGYSAPGFSGRRILFPISVLDPLAWESLARLSVLPLLVGMWEGMESARACYSIAEAKLRARRIDNAVAYWTVLCLAAATICIAAWLRRAPLLLPAALTLSGTIALAGTGAFRRAVATPGLAWFGPRFGLSENWRDAAPIGRVLLVLAAPALLPLCADLWLGLEGPFRLPSDASGYLYFWRESGLHGVADVSVGGIFGHEMGQIALYAAGSIGLLLVGWLFNAIVLRDREKGLAAVMWVLVPVALLAAAFIPVLQAASQPTVAPIVAAAGLPAVLLIAKPEQRRGHVMSMSVAVALLGAWAYVIWSLEALPPFTLLAATIVWRFLISPGDLNDARSEERFRRICIFSSLALLGLGMLVLDHGSRSALVPGTEIAEVTDRVAVGIVAPIWLVYYAARDIAPERS
jgi:hypothetical protein